MRSHPRSQSPVRSFHRHLVAIVSFSFSAGSLTGHAQISLTSAIEQALQKSERMQAAEADIKKARASLAETRDVFVPSVTIASGLGASSGITLSVPTVFTANAQSLVFNYSQRNYIRASNFGVEAATHSWNDARQQVEEDVATTYFSLENASEKEAALKTQLQSVSDLVSIVNQRLAAGYDTELELLKAQKEAAQVELQRLQVSGRIGTLTQHLAGLMGVPRGLVSMPVKAESADEVIDWSLRLDKTCSVSGSVLAAQAEARAKWQTSVGDTRYTWRPQVGLQAQYGRISPFNNVSSYYNLNGNYNTLAVGIQIQLPLLDLGRRARARGSAAEASRAQHDAALMQQQQVETCGQLQRSISELVAQEKLSRLEYKIAAMQFEETLTRVSNGSGPDAVPLTPKDQQRARLQVGQKCLDSLVIKGQLMESYIHYLRQTDGLDRWIKENRTD